MDIGISTACLYPMNTEDALSALIDKDFQLFEIFFNASSEIEYDFVADLKKQLDVKHCRVKSIHPFTSGFESYLLFSNYQRRFEDGMKYYDRYFKAAAQLGASILVLHGDRNPQKSGLTDEEYFERYALLEQRGAQFGIMLAQENVNLYRSQNPEFIKKMTQYLGKQVHYVLDIKQAVRAGYDPFVMCKAMGENLVHIHVNDNALQHDCLLPGQGTMDYAALKQLLHKLKYNGDFIIEVYRKNFTCLNELKQSYSDLKNII